MTARQQRPITTPSLPPQPSGPPPLPAWADRPETQVPGYPGSAPPAPPLEGSPIQPVSPDDLLIDRSSSEELGRNLEAAGVPKPASGYEAHHIVPSRAGGGDMDAVRQKLAALGLDLNDAANGVWLPGAGAAEAPGEPAYHPRLNNDAYNRAIERAFANVETIDDALSVLRDIRSQLQDGSFTGIRPRPTPPRRGIEP